ncbi:BCS1 N terminal-domain-containing protein [Tricladium varicosporioides]|nr:BCS1 N terminal-domain-containing protein [Hymenoscyphus varicosporioides]
MGRGRGLESILDSAFPPVHAGNLTNSTDPLAGFSSSTLLESIVPGYGHIQRFLLYSFGFDVTILVTLGAVVWVGARIFRSMSTVFWGFLSSYFMAEITVSSKDEIHGHLIQFLAHQYKTSSSRRLMAETPTQSAWEMDSEETETVETTVDPDGNIKWLNFSNQEAKSQPRFTPAIGSHNFWHQGTYFQLRRKEVSVLDELGGGAATFKEKEVLTLSCFGRSTGPIKKLIQHAKAHYHLGHKAKTVVKRPAPKDMRRYGGRGSWVRVSERPCRPMKTVVLEEERKMDVMADINEYLDPKTAKWYANRGIPYRRGYLFHGPPGTGKTSLTFALAGVFGLDIHVVSLLEPTLTEEELGMLFTTLPARCIVLLEDIDTAGLVRTEQVEAEESKKESSSSENFNVTDLTKAIKKANQQSEEDRKKGISLSGLLNIIDGVASHEGRVLVMTTNHPEKLDEALIRPGRVDHQVAFGNATLAQIKELFERMYADDLPRTKLLPSHHALSVSPAHQLPNEIPSSKSKEKEIPTPPATPIISTSLPSEKSGERKIGEEPVSAEELSDIATKFSLLIPNTLFSPAEIQGFLLKRKKDPRKALRECKEWVAEQGELKRLRSRVMGVNGTQEGES